MEDIENLHSKAMELAEEATLARLRGDSVKASEVFRQAFQMEHRAASLVADRGDLEPTRSVLHRSAASLALECGETRQAEKLLGIALSGDPPEDIAEELRDLLDQANFQRHLRVRGVQLHSSEFQLSLTGSSIGVGIAHGEAFTSRVVLLQKIIRRTAQRKLKLPFDDYRRIDKETRGDLELYVSVPRAGSFAVTIRIGGGQFVLDAQGMDLATDTLTELLECFEMFVPSGSERLAERIGDESYYRNFVALARGIAPDGRKVRAVGLTAIQQKKERRVLLSTPVAGKEPAKGKTPRPGAEEVQVRGRLMYADSLREKSGKIRVVDENNVQHKISVPIGLMSDIVRPLYEENVVVTGRMKRKTIMLETIDRVEE